MRLARPDDDVVKTSSDVFKLKRKHKIIEEDSDEDLMTEDEGSGDPLS